MSKAEKEAMIQDLENQMKTAARNLDFEEAASLRDMVFELKASL